MSDELVKCSFWLNRSDVAWFKKRFGWGWSEQLRHLMHRERKALEKVDDRLVAERD